MRSTGGRSAAPAEAVVFLLDEDAATAEAVRRVAEMMNLDCQVYGSGLAFVGTFDRTRCGCVITEVRVPGIGGIQVLERLQAEGITLPVIFLAARPTVSVAVRAMRAGAFHFLEKPVREPELWDAIQEAVTLDCERRADAGRADALRDRLETLTPKEDQVLRLVALGKSNRLIAEELDVSVRTVEVRRKVLVRKLGLKSGDELLQAALAALSAGPPKDAVPSRKRFATRPPASRGSDGGTWAPHGLGGSNTHPPRQRKAGA